MKKSLFIFFIFLLPAINFAQEKVLTKNGSKITLFENKTWEYDSLILKLNNISKDIVYYNLKPHESVYKYPSDNSLKLKKFDNNQVTVIGSCCNGYFRVKSSTGIIGYINRIILDMGYNKQHTFFYDLSLLKAKNENRKMLIRGVSAYEINSVGEVTIAFDWAYLDPTKTIKYLEFTVTPYNNVGDIQKCEIDGYSKFTGEITGPIEASNKIMTNFYGAWYNSSISCIVINRVKVTYMDNSSYVYLNELPKILETGYQNKCK
jgi:hypothetical protein